MLKKIIISSLLSSVVFSLTAQALPSAPTGKKWVEVSELTDDFNSFDSNKWQKGHPYWSGRAPSVYNNNNIAVTDGLLKLNMSVKDPSQNGNWIWAACVTSKTKAFTKGMYSEVKIKVADLSVTSSFWMQGAYSEIDVIENYGRVENDKWRHLDSLMGSNTHYFSNGGKNDDSTSKNFPNPGGARNADKFYTYGVWWKDNRNVTFYRDDQEVGSAVTKANFDEPMYVFFDMETFTWGPGIPTQAQLNDSSKNTAYYDYVKTYKLIDGVASSAASSQVNNTSSAASNGTAIPGKIEAENFSAERGTQVEATTDTDGGKNVGYIENGDFLEFDVNVATAGNYNIGFRLASDTNGGNIYASSNGSNFANINLGNTGGWQNWTTRSAQAYLNAGKQKIRLDFSGDNTYLLNINWINFSLASAPASSKPASSKNASSSSQAPVIDQCNTTQQCKTIFGAQATDCKNSQSAQSICMCGASACSAK